MSQIVYVVRHGEREDYVNRNWIKTAKSGDNPPLAEKGRQQAQELAERLKNEPEIQHIFASPFVRCVETAHIIAEALDKPVQLESGICEVLWDFPGGYETAEESKKKFPRVDTTYKPVLEPTEAEDTDWDCEKRTVGAIKQLWKRNYTGNLLFVGHAASCKGIVQAYTGHSFYPGLCTLTKLVNKGNGWKVELSGDASHLSDQSNLRPW